MTTDAAPASETPLGRLALEKLERIFGPAAAKRLFDQTLEAAALVSLDSAEDLYTFGEQLASRSGMEAAAGRLITVAAMLRGASGRSAG